MSQARRIPTLVLALTCVWLSAAQAAKTYTNKQFLYSVDYPDDWKAKEVGRVAVFSSPKESEEDTFAENVSIVVEDLGAEADAVSLIDYHRRSSGGASRTLNDFKMLEEAQTQWEDRTAVNEIYTASVRGEKFKFRSCKFKSGSAFYVLTYTAREADFESLWPRADRLMRSIRVSP